MSKFPMVVQAVYEGLELHEMVFLRDELERRTGALKDGAMPSETKERDKPAPAVLSAAGAGAPGFDEIGGGAPPAVVLAVSSTGCVTRAEDEISDKNLCVATLTV